MSHRAALAALAVTLLATGPAPSADRASVDYSVTPLTLADVNFYLAILRAAAVHNAHLSGEDRQAVALVEEMQRHPSSAAQGSSHASVDHSGRNARLMERAATLAAYDETIANEHDASARYNAIKAEVEQVVAALDGAAVACGPGGCGGRLTTVQAARNQQLQAAINADKPLIAPHEAEIVALRKEVGGFMSERKN